MVNLTLWSIPSHGFKDCVNRLGSFLLFGQLYKVKRLNTRFTQTAQFIIQILWREDDKHTFLWSKKHLGNFKSSWGDNIWHFGHFFFHDPATLTDRDAALEPFHVEADVLERVSVRILFLLLSRRWRYFWKRRNMSFEDRTWGHATFSVARFGDISPIWQQKFSLWQFLEGLFSLWQNLEPTLVNFYAFGKKCNVINEKWSSHLVTLATFYVVIWKSDFKSLPWSY